MAVVRPAFLDTTVLLAGLIDLGAVAADAQRLFDAIADGRLRRVATAWHCCLEFYAVSTRLPAEFRLAPDAALQLIESEILARMVVHQLPDNARNAFLRGAEKERVAGGRIYDAHIAEIARLSGAGTVVTDNRRHFTMLLRYGVRVLSTEEFVAAMGW